MKVKPLPGYVLVEGEKTKTSQGGIVLAKEVEKNEGIVVAVGESIVTEQMTLKCPVKVGEKVVYKVYEDEIDGKKLIRFVDLMAVIYD